MKKLNFEIHINAPREKVWDTMLGSETYKDWTVVFNPGGSWYEGSWDKGSKIYFIGPDENGNRGGMVSEIEDNRQHEFISIHHLGFLRVDKEVTEGPEVEGWKGAHENYTLVDENGGTKLIIDVDVTEQFENDMSVMWPKALERLKEMCEK